MKPRFLSSLIAGSLIVVCSLLFCGVAAGDTVYVDPNGFADFTTIQAAISDTATITGDVVIVMPGTYVENIDMSGKAITLRSSDPGDAAVVAATIIDGNATGSVITCDSGEDPNTVIDGFLITNGDAYNGGGMYNLSSSPTVINCTFSANFAAPDEEMEYPENSGHGGGMYNEHSSPIVTDCTFSGNSAGTESRGGGMCNISSSPTVTDTRFIGNTACTKQWAIGQGTDENGDPYITFDFGGGDGGGMYNDQSSPILTGCTFNGNSTGLIYFTGHGGGIYNIQSSPTVTDCKFNLNTSSNGGGIYNDESAPTVTDCTFTLNMSGIGGGMFNVSLLPTVTDSYFCGNGQIAIEGGVHANSSGNTIYEYCPPQAIVQGDVDGDGDVDFEDFALMGANWLEGT